MSTNEQPEVNKASLIQARVLSAVAVAGIESILREVSIGEIDSPTAVEKIKLLLDEHSNQSAARAQEHLQ
jgi:hypothetical protein